MMDNKQRECSILSLSSQADYWAGRKGLEAEEQYEYCLKMIRFLVTKCDTGKRPTMQNGTGLVFPSL